MAEPIRQSEPVTSPTIHLWDGKDYDSAALRSVYPDLLAHAERHATLREACPVSARRVVRRAIVIYSSLSILMLAPVTAGIGWASAGWYGVLLGLAVLIAISVFVTAVCAWSEFHTFRRSRPISVAVRAGRLWVFAADKAARCWRLDHIEWYVGPLSDSTFHGTLPPDSVIVLCNDREPWLGDERLGVGYTEQTRAVWHQFLSLTGLLRRTAWERRWTLRRVADSVVGYVLLWAILSIGFLAYRCAVSELPRWGLVGGEEQIAAVPLPFLSVFFLVYHVLVWPWHGLLPVYVAPADDASRRIGWTRFLGLCMPMLILAGCMLFGMEEQVPLVNRLTIVALWMPLLLAIAWYLSSRLSALKWQKVL